MKSLLKSALNDAIQTALNDNADNECWDEYVHPELVQQMTEAAAQVFDSAQMAQKFARVENYQGA